MTNDGDSADQVSRKRVMKHAYIIQRGTIAAGSIVKQSYSDLSVSLSLTRVLYACASQRTRYIDAEASIPRRVLLSE